MIHKTLLSALFVFLFSSNTYSQYYLINKQLKDSCGNNLYFNFENTSFLKDNEYANNFTAGFTGIGFFVKPTLEYYFTKNTKVNAGIYLLKYSGRDNFTQAIPIFSVQQRLNRHIDMVIGSIYSTNSHKIMEPIFRTDRYYLDNVEYGLQFLVHSRNIESDLWLNWENFILKDDPFQESIQIGSTSNFRVLSKKIEVAIPLQLLIFHQGGQINSDSTPMSTIFNGATGVKFSYNFNTINSLSIEPLLFLYEGLDLPKSGVNHQWFKSGNATYLKVKYSSRYFSTMIGYWHSKRFIAPKGEYLFQNVSEVYTSYYQEYRNLITFKFSFKYKISESINIAFQNDEYYDISTHNLAQSYALYFMINESFFLKKVKKESLKNQ